MFRNHSPTLTVVLLALCLTWVNSSTMSGSQPKPPAYPPMIPEEECECCNQITVQGNKIIKVSPNVAYISVSLSLTSTDITDLWQAQQDVSSQITSIVNSNGGKIYAFPPVVDSIGFQGSYDLLQQFTIQVKIKNDFGVLQRIIKAISQIQFNPNDQVLSFLTINGIKFDRIHDSKALCKAREQAIKDAFQKAEVFICAADGKLGKVQSIKEIRTESQPLFVTSLLLYGVVAQGGVSLDDVQGAIFDTILIEIKSSVQIKFCVSWPSKPHKPSPKPQPSRPRPK